MLIELGYFAMLLWLPVAWLQIMPMFSAADGVLVIARRSSFLGFGLLLCALLLLTAAFVGDDFSVALVYRHSQSMQPLIYKIAAVWGNHEGSLLLAVFVLTLWSAALHLDKRLLGTVWLRYIVGTLGFVQFGFGVLLIFLSNPFERLNPFPEDGLGLNPLLQDPLVSVHPPLFYLGYLGLAVPFAFAVAAIISARADAKWAGLLSGWMWLVWALHIIGIGLGAAWSYYELGWGGFWAWDPVENGALMPWLIATAATHALILLEKRGVAPLWAVFLCLLGFTFSLTGLFMVRSGIVDSVHTFAADPNRGLFIIMLLGLICGGAFVLYAVRAYRIRGHLDFAPLSRETFMLVSQLLLFCLTVIILLGSLYPLLVVIAGERRVGVGAPWYLETTTPAAALVVALAILAPLVSWRRFDSFYNQKRFVPLGLWLIILALAVLTGGYFLAEYLEFDGRLWVIPLSAAFAVLYFAGVVLDWSRKRGVPTGKRLARLLGHGALVLWIAALPSAFLLNQDAQVALKVGEEGFALGQKVRLLGVQENLGANYTGITARLEFDGNEFRPSRNHYFPRGDQTSEMALDVGILQDTAVSVGKPQDEVFYISLGRRPMIVWIWLGVALLALSGFIAAGCAFRKQITVKD